MSTRSKARSHRNSSIRVRSAHSSHLPSYAQPTISFNRRNSNEFIKYSKNRGSSTPLKAGISRGDVLPPKSPPVQRKTPTKKQSSLASLFSETELKADDRNEIRPVSIKNRSFRSPTFVTSDVTTVNPLDLKSLITVTAKLIDEASEAPSIDKSIEEALNKAENEDRSSVSTNEWKRLIESQVQFAKEVKLKAERDQKLINNVLELNNTMSKKVNSYRFELEQTRRQVQMLKELLNSQSSVQNQELAILPYQPVSEVDYGHYQLSPFISQANSPVISSIELGPISLIENLGSIKRPESSSSCGR